MNQPQSSLYNQPGNNPKPPMNKWLWITLITVVIIGGAFAAWYFLMGPGKAVESSTATTTTTPATTTTTDTTATTTPTTSTSTGTATSTNKTFSGAMNTYNTSTNSSCGVNISFQYPSDFTLSQTKYSAGTMNIFVSKDSNYQISFGSGAQKSAEFHDPNSCVAYENVSEAYSSLKFSTPSPAQSSTVNGFPAMTGLGSADELVVIYNPTSKTFVSIKFPYYQNANVKPAIDVIVKSFKFN